SLERELQDAQPELKTIDDSNKLIQSSSTRKSLSNRIHDDDDDDEELSDADSNVIQMKQTLNEFKHISFLSKPNISMNNIDEKKNHPKLKTINLTDLQNNDISSVI
ncbi:unnamed protein product, partial [Rotaria sp. Silwood1]